MPDSLLLRKHSNNILDMKWKILNTVPSPNAFSSYHSSAPQHRILQSDIDKIADQVADQIEENMVKFGRRVFWTTLSFIFWMLILRIFALLIMRLLFKIKRYYGEHAIVLAEEVTDEECDTEQGEGALGDRSYPTSIPYE